MIGTTIKGYQINRLLGEGGMAKVYEAIVNERLGTKVAIKVLHPSLAVHEGIQRRFEQEAMSMAQLNHPYIARVLDYEDEGEHLAMILEYLEGETLRERIFRAGAFEPKEALRIFGKVLDAFQYVHDKGIVHRDVKPSNIFLTEAGEPKVLDFGIVKLLETDSVQTRTGVQIGTPIYMSPEQVRTPRDVDHRTDIYSLGVTLHHLISGTPPYDQNTHSEWEIQTKIVKEPLPLLAGVPQKLNKIIQQATSKDRETRFQSCSEFKQAFRQKQSRSPKIKPAQPTPPPSIPQAASPDLEATVVEHAPISQAQGFVSSQTPPLTPPPSVEEKHRPKAQPFPEAISQEVSIVKKRHRRFSRNYRLSLLFFALAALYAIAESRTGVIDDEEPLKILVIIGSVFLLLSLIYGLALVHKAWQSIQDAPLAFTTPGKAIGFLFIPLFNFYWMFITFRQLAVEMNRYARDYRVSTGRLVSEGLAIAFCIFNLPVISYLGIFINILLYPRLLKQIKGGTIAILESK